MKRAHSVVFGLLVAGLVAGGAACSSAPPADPLAISVSEQSCGGTWTASGGVRTFHVSNTGTVTMEVDLTDPKSGGVYGEVFLLAPRTTRPMQVRLGHGAYAFRCYPADNDAVTGPTVQVTTGSAQGSPAVAPVSRNDMYAPIQQYDAYVMAGLATLTTDVAVLERAAQHGTRAQAEAAWLTAHLQYNRLGAAYDSFGDFADEIDGLDDGLPGGVSDPGFTGFHRIEYDLWHGAPMPSVAAYTKQLVDDVAGLRTDFPDEQIDPNDMPLRAHEIIENSVEFQLSGHADYGSGTSLATAVANLDGDQEVLDVIAPVLSTRDASWASIGDWMAKSRTSLQGARRSDGGWIPVADLDPAAAQRIDAAEGGLLEALAPVAAIGDMRRTQ